MNPEEYSAITKGIDEGNVRSVYNALEFSSHVLEEVVKQSQVDDRRKDAEMALHLVWRLCDAVRFQTMPASYWRGQEQQEHHTKAEDDDFSITQSSYEQHWQNKGRQFFEDLAKNIREREAGDKVKGVEEDIQKAKQERVILERKAAAFDEIAGEIVGLYRAVNTVRACLDGDCDQYKVHLAMIDAMFSLGVVAQIIAKIKEDAA